MNSTARAATEALSTFKSHLQSIFEASDLPSLSQHHSIEENGRRWLQLFPPLLVELHQKDALSERWHDPERTETDTTIASLTYGMGETICWLAEALHCEPQWSGDTALEPLNERLIFHHESLALLQLYLKRYEYTSRYQ